MQKKQTMTEENIHFTKNDRIFYSDGFQLVQTAIQQGFSKDTLFTAIDSLYAAIDGLNNSIISLANRQNISVACFKGCQWCCHQAVFANSYELHYLSEKIRINFKKNEIQNLIEDTKAKLAVTLKLNNDEILSYKAPCPLLKSGACSVYESRPMACRIYLSTKLETCLEFYHHPKNETNYPALIDFPLRAGRMMNEGFSAALKEYGVETAEFRLEEGLLIVLKNVQ